MYRYLFTRRRCGKDAGIDLVDLGDAADWAMAQGVGPDASPFGGLAQQNFSATVGMCLFQTASGPLTID